MYADLQRNIDYSSIPINQLIRDMSLTMIKMVKA